MIFGDQEIEACLGAILAHSQPIGDKRLAKGHRLTIDDIAAARSSGIERLTVAMPGADDIDEADAASAVGAALSGAGTTARAPIHGRVNITANHHGLLQFDPDAVRALNRIDESITLGTAQPFARVRAGDIIATVKIIPFAVPGATLQTVVAAAAAATLSVAPFTARSAHLILSQLPGQADKVLAKTIAVTRTRIEALGGHLSGTTQCSHDSAAIVAGLRAATADILLVAGASATSDRGDTVPAAITAAGGSLIRVGMPVDPGNLLVLGELGGRPVLGLPGCARSPKHNGVDLVLERLFAGLGVTSGDIADMGVGGLLADIGDRPAPRSPATPSTGPVGALLLAAGRSTRMGGSNKLVTDLEGRPLVSHAATAITTAGLPLIIVTGNAPDAVQSALAAIPAAFVHAPDFADGLSCSLRTGARAVPPDWRGLLVCLGDMPRVTPATLHALIAALASDDAIIVPVTGGKRGNPVLWGRAHIERLTTLAGDVGGKALLGELADHVVEVDVADDGIFADVDTPADLRAIAG